MHVPFCVSVCPYCDFVVLGGSATRGPRSRIPAFTAALAVELALRADALDTRWGPPGAGRPPLDSVYLGGGTPSLLPPAEIESILGLVAERYAMASAVEITLEANPSPDERGDLRDFAAAGVTRVSFGAQSFDRAELRRLGRRHSPEDVVTAVEDARAAGIGSVNLDLLYDLPGQTPGSWSASLAGVLALVPEHLSLYALSLGDPEAEGLVGPLGDHLPTRPGARRWRERARRQQDEDRAVDAYCHAVGRLAAAGYDGYELSNWALPGHASRHNLVYWERRPHEGVGPGAHAFDGATRRWNAARLDDYLAALVPGGGAPPHLPPGGSDPLDAPTAAAESLVLGLRLARGVPLESAEQEPFASVAPWALETGLLERSGDRLRLTTRGRLLSNEVFARLV